MLYVVLELKVPVALHVLRFHLVVGIEGFKLLVVLEPVLHARQEAIPEGHLHVIIGGYGACWTPSLQAASCGEAPWLASWGARLRPASCTSCT